MGSPRVEGRGLRMGYADAEKLDFEDIPLDLNFIVLITLQGLNS